MQVILLHDVERVGHEGDVLNVADGYARNYLLPRKLALHANKGALRELQARQHAIERRNAEKRGVALKAAEELQAKTVVVLATTGQGTKLHGTVTTAQVAEAASQQFGLQLDRRDIDIAEPIRETGDYLISVRLYKDVAAQLPVRVVSRNAQEPEVSDEPLPAATPAEAEMETADEADGADEADEADE
jgi:large subunit ribosomal protein L9